MTKLGTVVDFPLGDSSTKQKVNEAIISIDNGAHDIDLFAIIMLLKEVICKNLIMILLKEQKYAFNVKE